MARSAVPIVDPRNRPRDPAKGFHAAYELTVDDHMAVSFGSSQSKTLWPWFYGAAALALFISLAATFRFWRAEDFVRFFAINGSVLAIFALVGLIFRDRISSGYRNWVHKDLFERGALGVPLEFSVEREGLTMVSGGMTTKAPWDSLLTIEEQEDGPFYFWINRQSTYVWPARLFGSKAERQAFRLAIGDWAGYRPVSPPLLARLNDAERREFDNGRLTLHGFVDRRKDR